MIKQLIYILAFVSISCKTNLTTLQSDSIYLYKNNDRFDIQFEVIESTFWDMKESGGLDILRVSDSNEQQLLIDVIENSRTETYITKPFLHPEYAVLLRYNFKQDTLYIDEDLRKAYFTQNDLQFEFEDDKLYQYFEDKNFLTDLSIYRNNK